MDNKIKCSIITVSYNSALTIERTIKSVLNQTYDNIEYIIVDGNSRDETVAIVKRYEAAFGGRLRWTSEPDDGLYFAMDKGIEMATGELIGIINSDDWYEENAVEIMIKEYSRVMTEKQYDEGLVLYGKMRSWDGDKEIRVARGDHNKLRESMIGHPTCFVSARTYEKYGAFDTRYISASDYDMMLRFYEYGVRFEPVEKVIANFSLGGMCSTGKAYYDLLKVKRRHGLISSVEYLWIVAKCRLYDFLNSNKSGE